MKVFEDIQEAFEAFTFQAVFLQGSVFDYELGSVIVEREKWYGFATVASVSTTGGGRFGAVNNRPTWTINLYLMQLSPEGFATAGVEQDRIFSQAKHLAQNIFNRLRLSGNYRGIGLSMSPQRKTLADVFDGALCTLTIEEHNVDVVC